RAEGRQPPLLALENVCGALTSHGGEDFVEICKALAGQGYRCGALVIDAALFLPQSRPRLFIVAAREDVTIPLGLIGQGGEAPFATPGLLAAYARLPLQLRESWL